MEKTRRCTAQDHSCRIGWAIDFPTAPLLETLLPLTALCIAWTVKRQVW